LPWCVTRAKARRRATAASPGCGMPAGSVCRQSRTNVTRCSDQLVQHGRVVPGCFGVVTGGERVAPHLPRRRQRAGHNESTWEAAAPVPLDQLYGAGISVPEARVAERVNARRSRGEAPPPVLKGTEK
jgi:hypothetical protein